MFCPGNFIPQRRRAAGQFQLCVCGIFLLLICSAFSAQAQNFQQYITDYHDARFLNDQAVIACGSNGMISHSADAGASWTSTQPGYPATTFHCLEFLDEQRGWVAGEGGLILETNDGGQTWTEIFTGSDPDETILDLSITASGVGIAVGTPAFLWRTVNFGKTWAPLGPSGEQPFLRVEAFANGNFAVGAYAVAYFSGDRGRNWSEIEFEFEGNKEWLIWNSSCVDSDGNVLLAPSYRNENFLLRSADGSSWEKIPARNTIRTMAADADIILSAAGTTDIAYSASGGMNWATATVSEPLIEVKDQITPVHAMVIRGENALLFTERNGILQSADKGKNWELRSFLPSLNIRSGSIDDQGVLTVLSADMKFSTGVDNGRTWYPFPEVYLESEFKVFEYQNPYEDYEFAVGNNGTIMLRTIETKGLWRKAWYESEQPIEFRSTDMEVESELLNVAVGVSGGSGWTMALSEDAGQVWTITQYGSATEFHPQSVRSLGGTRWIVVGGPGRTWQEHAVVAVSDDNCETWTYQEIAAPCGALQHVAQISSELLIAVSGNGFVIRSADNGATWSTPHQITDQKLNRVVFYDETRGIAAGDGVIMYTSDAGESWVRIDNSMRQFRVTDVIFNAPDHAYFFGDGLVGARLDLNTVTDLREAQIHSANTTDINMLPLSPHPVRDVLHATVSVSATTHLGAVSVRVFNYLGVEVMDVSPAFTNEIPQSGLYHGEFSTADLTNGCYFLHCNIAQNSITRSFIVLRE